MDINIIMAIITLIGICITALFSFLSAIISSNNKKNGDLIYYQINDIKADLKELQIRVDKTENLENRIVALETILKGGLQKNGHS